MQIDSDNYELLTMYCEHPVFLIRKSSQTIFFSRWLRCRNLERNARIPFRPFSRGNVKFRTLVIAGMQ
jgi:hypothetical protein